MTIEWKVSQGLTDYLQALEFMEKRVELINQGKANELIWLLEHNEVYTAGTSARDEELISQPNFPVISTGRGGKYTYHGPGQRIIYIMLNLKKKSENIDLRKYIKSLEEWTILSLSLIGIKALVKKNYIGVWVKTKQGDRKIAAIGVRVRKGITYHGIAVNINPNISNYDKIIPCGISNYGITSVSELGYNIEMNQFDKILKNSFYTIFNDDE